MLQVTFVGRHPIDWLGISGARGTTESAFQSVPGPSEPASTSASPTITTDIQLRAEFVAYLYNRLHNDNGFHDHQGNTKMATADRKKEVWSVIVVASDPSSSIASLNVDMAKAFCQQQPGRDRPLDFYFEVVYADVAARSKTIDLFWNRTSASHGQKTKTMATWGGVEHDEDDEDDNDDVKDKDKDKGKKRSRATSSVGSTVSSRPTADRRAQTIVPGWYDHRCVLSGVPLPDAAHIVPVRMTQSNGNLIEPWNALRGLLPLPDLEELRVAGQEVTNILPLNAATHRQWDRYQFALRPLLPTAVPDDGDVVDTPPHRIWIQMVWLDDEATRTATTTTTSQRDHRRWGGLVDFRRPDEHGHFVGIEHGDVYEITTTDPERWPLPSLRLLEMQYGAHKLLGGMRATAVLQDIFSGDPPDDDEDDFGVGASLTEDDVPHEWRSLIDAAVDKGVLSHDVAQKWKTAAAVALRWRLIRAGLVPHPDDDDFDDP